jgi:hypothetical protein
LYAITRGYGGFADRDVSVMVRPAMRYDAWKPTVPDLPDASLRVEAFWSVRILKHKKDDIRFVVNSSAFMSNWRLPGATASLPRNNPLGKERVDGRNNLRAFTD